MNKKIKQKPVIILVIAITVILVSCGVYYYLISNMHKTIIEIRELVVESGEQNSELSDVNMIVNTAKETKEDRDKLDSFFISDNEAVIAFIELVESLAVDSEISMDSVISQLDNAIQFRLTIQGEYSGIYRYLELIENLPYNVEVSRANFIYKRTEVDGTRLWDGNLDIVFTGYNTNGV